MSRRKVEMKRIANNSARRATFSKRRSGLFKKASDLATLCGAEVGIAVYSSTQKLFSFAQPSPEVVFDKFLNQGKRPARGEGSSARPDSKKDVHSLSKKLEHIKDGIKAERAKKEKLKMVDTVPIDVGNLGFEELLRLKEKMDMIRDATNKRFSEMESDVAKALVLMKYSANRGSDKIPNAN